MHGPTGEQPKNVEQRVVPQESRVEQRSAKESVYEQIQADLKEVGRQHHELDTLRVGIQENLDHWNTFLDTEVKEGRNVFQYGPQIADVQSRLEAAQQELKRLGTKYYELTEEIEPFDQLKENDESLKRQATESVEMANEMAKTQTEIEQTRYAWSMTVQHRDRAVQEARQAQQALAQLEATLKEQEGWHQDAKEQLMLYRPYAEHPQYGDVSLSNGVTYKQYAVQLEDYQTRVSAAINQTRAQLGQAEEQYANQYRQYTGLEQQQSQLADKFLQAQARLGQLHEKRYTLQQEGYQTKYDRPTLESRTQGVVNMRQARQQARSSVPPQYN